MIGRHLYVTGKFCGLICGVATSEANAVTAAASIGLPSFSWPKAGRVEQCYAQLVIVSADAVSRRRSLSFRVSGLTISILSMYLL